MAIPSDLLEAQGAVDTTLRNILFLMGGLALLVGGVGIANVMSISVIQRSGEIGIRRALGHTKVTIAMQFVLEALFVGVLGGLAGVLAGVGVIYLVSAVLGWVATPESAIICGRRHGSDCVNNCRPLSSSQSCSA